MLKPESFDVCKKATVPIIVMLGHSEIDIKILDVSMETMEFNDYREISEDNRDINKMLAIMQERARFFCKNR